MIILKRILAFDWSKVLLTIGCILIAVWPALYNRYPLVTSDTGTYIGTFIPMDRPFGYHVFLSLTSLGLSLWFPVFMQGILFVWLMVRICHVLLGKDCNKYLIVSAVFASAVFTAEGWYLGQLMPDAFTGIYLLALVWFYIDNHITNVNKWLLLLLFFFCGVVHTSHILIGGMCSLLVLIYSWLLNHRKAAFRSLKIVLCCVASAVVIGLSNLKEGYGFCLSPVSHMFFIARMAENGILDSYLDNVCPVDSGATVLCKFRGNTGERQWDLMWGEQYPHNQKGWISVKKDYSNVILKSFTKRRLLLQHAVVFGTGGLEEIGNLYIGDGLDQSYGTQSNPYQHIERKFPMELKAFRSDLQNNHLLPINEANGVIYICSFLLIILAVLAKGLFPEVMAPYQRVWRKAFLFAGLFMVVNAFMTAEFSTVLGRYQARVFWVLPVLCYLYLLQLWIVKKGKKGATDN